MYDNSYLKYAAFGHRAYFSRSDSSFREIPAILYPRSITTAIRNSIGFLSQTLYWAQLTEDLSKYKHPQFFSSQFLQKFSRYSYQISLSLRRICFLKISLVIIVTWSGIHVEWVRSYHRITRNAKRRGWSNGMVSSTRRDTVRQIK